jgi:hypothetical protein
MNVYIHPKLHGYLRKSNIHIPLHESSTFPSHFGVDLSQTPIVKYSCVDGKAMVGGTKPVNVSQLCHYPRAVI